MYPTTGYTPSISKQEADKNYLETLRAMVAEYPTNEYWRGLLENFRQSIEVQHDAEWLDTNRISTESNDFPNPCIACSVRHGCKVTCQVRKQYNLKNRDPRTLAEIDADLAAADWQAQVSELRG